MYHSGPCSFASYCVCVWPKLCPPNSNSTKKWGIGNLFCQENWVFISHSNIQNHFSLVLSIFGELNSWISVRVLLCVYDQNYALIIVTHPEKEVGNPLRQEDWVFIPHSNMHTHFCLSLSCLGELNFQISTRVFFCLWMTKITFS